MCEKERESVCVRERERETDKQTERQTETENDQERERGCCLANQVLQNKHTVKIKER